MLLPACLNCLKNAPRRGAAVNLLSSSVPHARIDVAFRETMSCSELAPAATFHFTRYY
jgi:hypothetical protein